jgi:hypothetical protein
MAHTKDDLRAPKVNCFVINLLANRFFTKTEVQLTMFDTETTTAHFDSFELLQVTLMFLCTSVTLFG